VIYGLAVIVLSGIVLLVVGVRGRRVGDDPHCAACGFNLRGLEVGPLGRRPAAADAMENVTLLLGADHLTGVFNYRVDVFPAERVKEATDHYVALLAQVAADPDLRLSAIDLSPSSEQHSPRRLAGVR